MIKTLISSMTLTALLATAQAEPRHGNRRNVNYILRRQQVMIGLGVPTSRMIYGRREIDIYRNGMMFEGDDVVGVKAK